jgi:hypothetical protein
VQNLTVSLIGKPGCHLCDDAEVVVSRVLKDYPQVSFDTPSLLDHPEWSELYAEKIPVLLIEGTEFAHWHVNEEDFRHELDRHLTLSLQRDSE